MKKIILFGLLMVLLVGIGNATELSDMLTQYHSFDVNQNDESGNGTNPSVTGATHITSGMKLGAGAYTFDGNDYMTFSSAVYSNSNDFSICSWFNSDDLTSQRHIWQTTTDYSSSGYTKNGNFYCGVRTGTSNYLSNSTTILSINTWYLGCCVVDSGSNISLYINGNLEDTDNIVGSPTSTTGLRIGTRREATSEFWDGEIDEFMVFDEIITLNQIETIYNSGDGLPYPFETTSVADTLNISVGQPENNTQFLTNTINFNTTVNSTYDFNCSLYINSTLNQTTTGYSSGSDVTVSFNATLGDGEWNHHISCFNNATQQNTTTNTFYVDTVFPNIAQSGFTNNTFYYNGLLNMTINFTDDQSLFSYNISIDGTDVNNSGGILDSALQINWTYNISSLAPGQHTLTIQTADGHTAKELKGDYDWSNGLFNDYLEYRVYTGNTIKIKEKDGSWFDDWTTEKKTDRYSFKYKPDKLKNKYTFVVTSIDPISIVENEDTPWKKWFVIGDHWLDFYPYTDVEISKVKDNEVYVTISNVDPTLKELEFNSIGDLNIIQVNYTFYTTNTTLTYSDPVSEISETTVTLDINTTNITSTEASLVWNGSSKTTTKTSYATYDSYVATFTTPTVPYSETNVSFTWTFNTTGITNLTGETVTQNQTITKLQVDNCSTYTTNAFNFSIRNESSDAYVFGDVAGYFELWSASRSSYTTFNLSWNNVSNGSICINPAGANYSVYSQLEYDADGFDSKTYYLTNTTLSNQTQTATLYLTDGTTAVTFTVKDQDDNDVQDVYIHILKYDLGTNSYVTSEIIKTDQDGEAIGQVVLTTQWYKFLLVYESATVLETEPIKLTTVTRNFRINLLDDFLEEYNKNKGVTKSLTFTNSTGNFAFTFLNPTGTDVNACLEVTKRTPLGDVLVNESCVTSASGTILVNIGGDRTGVYIGTATIYASPWIFEQLTIDYENAYKQWGADGVFASFFLRVTFVMIGIWNPFVGIALLILGDILMAIFGLVKFGWGTIIIYLIFGGLVIAKMRTKE